MRPPRQIHTQRYLEESVPQNSHAQRPMLTFPIKCGSLTCNTLGSHAIPERPNSQTCSKFQCFLEFQPEKPPKVQSLVMMKGQEMTPKESQKKNEIALSPSSLKYEEQWQMSVFLQRQQGLPRTAHVASVEPE